MTVEIEQLVKGSKMRLDLTLPDGGQSFSQISDMASGQRIMLLHEQEMWADMAAMSAMIPGFNAPASAATDAQPPEFDATDQLETIAGIECRHYILHLDGGEDVDVCAATGMGFFMPGAPAGPNGGGVGGAMPTLPQGADIWLEAFDDGFFVLSLEGGGASYRATEVESGSPPDEAFDPPSNYSEMQIPGF